MHIRDFFNLTLLEDTLKTWSLATGMAAVAMDTDGKYISSEIGSTDFCMKYTRTSAEGLRRCTKCNKEGTGTYFCHAGLMDFSIDIVVNGQILGKIIGGQVLANEPDEEQFKELAKELKINPEQYLSALRKLPVKTEQVIRSSAKLLGDAVNMLVNFEYIKITEVPLMASLDSEIEKATHLIQDINAKSGDLDNIQGKQRILALNASIEAARAGEFARGFAVVATEVGKLAEDSGSVNKAIKETVAELTKTIGHLESEKRKQDKQK